jgi:hypothetical protein
MKYIPTAPKVNLMSAQPFVSLKIIKKSYLKLIELILCSVFQAELVAIEKAVSFI